jgi:biotin carboxyl carrier protein
MSTKWLYQDTEVEALIGTVQVLPSGDIEVECDGRRVVVPCARDAQGRLWLAWQGRSFVFTLLTPGRKRGAAKKSGSLVAPMTGVVAEVLVTVGQSVTAYQPLATVEAMKVLATLEAPFAGTVTAVHVTQKDRVEHGAVLVELAPTGSMPPELP